MTKEQLLAMREVFTNAAMAFQSGVRSLSEIERIVAGVSNNVAVMMAQAANAALAEQLKVEADAEVAKEKVNRVVEAFEEAVKPADPKPADQKK